MHLYLFMTCKWRMHGKVCAVMYLTDTTAVGKAQTKREHQKGVDSLERDLH